MISNQLNRDVSACNSLLELLLEKPTLENMKQAQASINKLSNYGMIGEVLRDYLHPIYIATVGTSLADRNGKYQV